MTKIIRMKVDKYEYRGGGESNNKCIHDWIYESNVEKTGWAVHRCSVCGVSKNIPYIEEAKEELANKLLNMYGDKWKEEFKRIFK